MRIALDSQALAPVRLADGAGEVERFAAEALARYREIGADGIGSFSEPGDRRTYEMQHWLVARLSWNPSEDPEVALRWYLEARCGESAADVREAVRRVDLLWRTLFVSCDEWIESREHAERVTARFAGIAADLAGAGAEAELRGEIEDGAAAGRVIKRRLLDRGIETAQKKLQKRG